MRKILLLLALTALPAFAKKPNVILLYFDDLGYSDVGVYDDNQTSLTPNMDQLAAEGMRFDNGYSAVATCTGSRYAILTGRYSWRTSRKSGVTGGYSRALMAADRFTIGEMFQDLGYFTAMIGKWHIGMNFHSPEGNVVNLDNNNNVLDNNSNTVAGDRIDFSLPLTQTPTQNGFDYYFGTSASLDMPPYAWIENETLLYQGGFINNGVVDFSQARPATNADLLEGAPRSSVNSVRPGAYDPTFIVSDYTEIQAQKVIDIIKARSNESEPFFLYVPSPAPHRPWAVNSDFNGNTPYGYGDYIAQVDHFTGLILEAMKDPDGNPNTDDSIVDDTVVFLSSDNGPELIAQDSSIQAGRDSNGDFRGIKQDSWEGGLRVPFIIRWPGTVAAGSSSNHSCWQGDFIATMAEYLNYDLINGKAPDAESFLPILQGNSMPDERRVGTIQQSHSGQHSIVDENGEWKLIDGTGSGSRPNSYTANNTRLNNARGTIRGTPRQLFNLKTDPGETTNLLRNSPAQVHLDKEIELYALLNEIRGNTTFGLDGDSNVPPVDTDRDDIPNFYENAHAGLSWDDPSDANLDFEPDGLNNLQEFSANTDPNNTDTDGDDLSDFDEVMTYGTLPDSAFTDADDLDDGEEILAFFTDPLLFDTDSDGVSDSLEVQKFTNPLDPTSFPITTSISIPPSVLQLVGFNGTTTNPAAVGSWTGGNVYIRERVDNSTPELRTRMFLKFDLSSISETITSARIRLHQIDRLNTANSDDIQYAIVTEAWDSLGANYPTYNGTSVANSTVLGNNSDFGTSINSSGFFSGTAGSPGDETGFDITSIAQAWQNDSDANYGLRIAFANEEFVGTAFSATDNPSTLNQNEALELIITTSNTLDSDNDKLNDVYELAQFGNLDEVGTSDLDKDGKVTLLELALGSNPSANHSTPQFGLFTENSANGNFVYHRYNQGGLGVTPTFSEDLETWLPFTSYFERSPSPQTSDLGSDYDKVLLEPIRALPTKLFYRFQVFTK